MRAKFVFACVAICTFALSRPDAFAQSSPPDVPTALAEPAPTDTVVVRRGTLRDGDPLHRGSGTAQLLKRPDGTYVVRLENLEIVAGPDLFVYLAAHDDPLFPEDVTAGFHNLGALKSRFGDQNYIVPEGLDPAAYGSVVIWCDIFKVQFAVAALN